MLEDQSGQNLEWDGDAADCEAWLQQVARKGKGFVITTLDVETFPAAS